MRTATKCFAIGVAALTVVSTACVDATRPTSIEPALYEGAPVSLTGSMQASAIINGQLVTSAIHEWAVDGVVKNGMALASRDPGQSIEGQSVPALAVSDTRASFQPNHRNYASTKDKLGNAHDFVLMNGKEGGPLNSAAHLVNGKIAESFSFDWRRVRGGWVAQGFAVTMFRDGKPVATLRSGTRLALPGISKMVVADDPCMFDAEYAALSGSCSSPPTLSGGGGSGGGTGGATPCSCAEKLAELLATTAANGSVTGDWLFAAGQYSAWLKGGMWTAWVYIGYLYLSYQDCLSYCYSTQPQTSGGGSGGGGGTAFNLSTGKSSR
jgi:hypothetical protein